MKPSSFASILLLVIVIALVSATAYIVAVPTETPFSVFSSSSRGLFLLASEDAKILASLDQLRLLDPTSSAVIIILSNPLEEKYYALLLDYVSRGGTLIVLDEQGYLITLLKAAWINGSIEPYAVLDPLYNLGANTLIYAEALIGNVSLVLEKPHPIKGGKPLIRTYQTSYLDLDGDEEYDPGEPWGPYVVGAEYKYGLGRIIVIGDADIITNKLYAYSKNFIKLIANGRKIYVDQSTVLRENVVDRLKYLISYSGSQSMVIITFFTVSGVAGWFMAKGLENRVAQRHGQPLCVDSISHT